ncbi:MAG: dihydropteroate synthase, partial [Bacillota bacterium]|nr:dihydropteroate synthase [Bacillota bacterium]
MILIAENLNSSIPSIQKALSEHNETFLIDLIQQLDASPADYLDLNAGLFHDRESAVLADLVNLVRRHSCKPLVLDSPDPTVLQSVCNLAGPGLLLNSITLERRRYDVMSALACEYSSGLIALLMKEDRMPNGIDERLEAADQLVSRLVQQGIPPERIFLDPMVRPVSTDDKAGVEAYQSISALKERFPQTHVIVGLSNISYGLPARKHINRAFLLQAMTFGLDSAIVNTLDEDLMALCRAGQVLAGQDEYCLNYL